MSGVFGGESRETFPTPPVRVAVLEPAFLGDVVFASPLTRALSRCWPQAEIAMVVRPPADEIARHLPGVGRVLVYDKRDRDRGWRGFRRAGRALRDFAPEIVISLHASARTAGLAYLSRAPNRWGPAESAASLLYTATEPLEGLPFALRACVLARALGAAAEPRLELSLPDALRAWGRAAVPAGAVALVPGSEWPTKRWPLAQIAALARSLAPRRKPVLLGAPSERALCAAINAEAGGVCLDLCGNRVEEALAVLSACDAVVGGDSGLSHAARALGRPVVTLFGPTAPELHLAEASDVFSSLRLSCSPCSDHGSLECPLGHHRCPARLERGRGWCGADRAGGEVKALLGAARRFGRWWLALLARLLPRAEGGAISEPRAILVVRTDDRVGNLLLTTPLLSALRTAFPHATLALLCAAKRASVVEGTGLYDTLWKFEKRDFFRRPWRFWRLLWRLRRARHDLAIEAGHSHAASFTSLALVRWSGARVRIGHRRGNADRYLTHVVERDPAVVYDAASKLELLAPLGVQAALAGLSTALGKARVGEWRASMGDAVVVNPGARKADHRWPAAEFAAVCRALRASTGAAVWVSWGPGEEALAREVASTGEARLLPPTDLEGLAGVFRAASAVVVNDTGPMHLAIAVGAPVVAVFLSADATRWASPQPNAQAVLASGRAPEAVRREVIESVARALAKRTF